MHKVLYRADANPTIGTGDLISLIELSRKFPSDWQHHFCCRKTEAALKILGSRNISRIHWLNDEDGHDGEKERLRRIIQKYQVDALVIEITGQSSKLYENIGQKVFKVCVNFCREFPEDFNLILDWSVEAPTWYPVSQYPTVEFLLGPQHVILPMSFEGHFTNRSAPSEDVQKILITMGGNDEWNLSISVLDSLEALQYKGIIRLILGAGYQHHGELKKIIQKTRLNVSVEENLPTLEMAYIWADLALATGGLTVSELVATKTPCLITAAYPHEESRCEYFHRKKWIGYTGLRKIPTDSIEKALIDKPPTSEIFPFHSPLTSKIVQAVISMSRAH